MSIQQDSIYPTLDPNLVIQFRPTNQPINVGQTIQPNQPIQLHHPINFQPQQQMQQQQQPQQIQPQVVQIPNTKVVESERTPLIINITSPTNPLLVPPPPPPPTTVPPPPPPPCCRRKCCGPCCCCLIFTCCCCVCVCLAVALVVLGGGTLFVLGGNEKLCRMLRDRKFLNSSKIEFHTYTNKQSFSKYNFDSVYLNTRHKTVISSKYYSEEIVVEYTLMALLEDSLTSMKQKMEMKTENRVLNLNFARFDWVPWDCPLADVTILLPYNYDNLTINSGGEDLVINQLYVDKLYIKSRSNVLITNSMALSLNASFNDEAVIMDTAVPTLVINSTRNLTIVGGSFINFNVSMRRRAPFTARRTDVKQLMAVESHDGDITMESVYAWKQIVTSSNRGSQEIQVVNTCPLIELKSRRGDIDAYLADEYAGLFAMDSGDSVNIINIIASRIKTVKKIKEGKLFHWNGLILDKDYNENTENAISLYSDSGATKIYRFYPSSAAKKA